MSVDISADSNLDRILTEVGEFGVFQVISYLLISIPCALSATFVVNYMISANTIKYRCKVPECEFGDNNRDIPYDQPWLRNAIPIADGEYANCFRYAPVHRNGTLATDECSANLFNTSTKIACSEFVYASDERNLQTEFNIHCSDSYKLALIGTINNVGRFIFLPLTGILSDRFGRLKVVVYGMVCSSLIGVVKSFSINYIMYIILEFIEASAGTCTFAGIFILGIEWVNSKYRVYGSTIISVSYPLGEMLLGFTAMYIHDFRYLIRALYTPGLLIMLYFWWVPESVRWLLVTGQVDRAIKTLKQTASVNRKQLSNKSIEMMNLVYSANSIAKNNNDQTTATESSMLRSLCSILKSKTLCFRFLNCCFCWMSCCFNYYGLSLISTHVSDGNRYVSFIFVTAVEIPGILIALPLLNRTKRRKLMFTTLALGAISIIVTPWIPESKSTIVLIFFMIGKASITCAFTVLYIFTAEQWPTNLRTTIMNLCSMIGRIGAMVAPLTAILETYNSSLPPLLFGGTSLLAAILVLFSPETFEKKLPDSIEEAKSL